MNEVILPIHEIIDNNNKIQGKEFNILARPKFNPYKYDFLFVQNTTAFVLGFYNEPMFLDAYQGLDPLINLLTTPVDKDKSFNYKALRNSFNTILNENLDLAIKYIINTKLIERINSLPPFQPRLTLDVTINGLKVDLPNLMKLYYDSYNKFSLKVLDLFLQTKQIKTNFVPMNNYRYYLPIVDDFNTYYFLMMNSLLSGFTTYSQQIEVHLGVDAFTHYFYKNNPISIFIVDYYCADRGIQVLIKNLPVLKLGNKVKILDVIMPISMKVRKSLYTLTLLPRNEIPHHDLNNIAFKIQ